MNILEILRSRFRSVLASLSEDVDPLLSMIRPSQDPKFGDYQANCAMSLKATLNRSPREIAEQIVAEVDVSDICQPLEIAGPGFINLRLNNDWISDHATAISGDDRLGYATVSDARNVVVDFSSPNVAKPMHVGHLRSTVIGDAIARTLRFAGHRVTTDNHIGDWGTQFGMIIYGFRQFADAGAYQSDSVGELARLYRLVNQLIEYQAAKAGLPELERQLEKKKLQLSEAEKSGGDRKQKKTAKALRKQLRELEESVAASSRRIAAVEENADRLKQAQEHPDIAGAARRETSKLHAGDPDNQTLWDRFLPACMEALNGVYKRMEIEFDLTLGESAYNDRLSGVVHSLRNKGLVTESDGAVCVFVQGNDAPFIVRKSDGAFTYATTDLATIEHRVQELCADEILYVVDKRQSEHFELLFETVRQWGYSQQCMRHISFGTVLGEDGKPYKTRSGDAVGLESLLDEAVRRARVVVDTNDDEREEALLSEGDRQHVATIVGLGGIRYADLQHNRDSDYTFHWDKMLATTGNTATYMQYAYARICGIFRRLGVDRETLREFGGRVILSDPAERALALQLLKFGEAVDAVLTEYRPHFLTIWLLETASRLSQFYNACSVQNAESAELQKSRLILCDLVARALRTGLSLLGIRTADVL